MAPSGRLDVPPVGVDTQVSCLSGLPHPTCVPLEGPGYAGPFVPVPCIGETERRLISNAVGRGNHPPVALQALPRHPPPRRTAFLQPLP